MQIKMPRLTLAHLGPLQIKISIGKRKETKSENNPENA
jgi:hypothetical protein